MEVHDRPADIVQCVDIGVDDFSAQRSSELPLAGRVIVMPSDDGYAYAQPGGEKQ